MKKPLLTITCLCVAFSFFSSANASETKLKPEWEKYFTGKTIDGTIVVYDLKKDTYFVYNQKRAEKRFSPASTFKIPNSLISLQAGSIKDTDNEIVKWDGVVRDIPDWNKDHTLRTAYAASCVPVYQELARRTGEKKMAYYMHKFKYGNNDISGGIDKFWLESSLQITAYEEVSFLKLLYKNDTSKLPFSKSNINKVKDIMLNEEGDDYKLRAKTGWGPDKQHIGWFVGWLEKADDVYFFALNIEMKDKAQLPYRKEIVKNILGEVSGGELKAKAK